MVALPLNDGLTLMEVNTGLARFLLPGTSNGGPLSVSPDDRLLAALRTTGTERPTAGGSGSFVKRQIRFDL